MQLANKVKKYIPRICIILLAVVLCIWYGQYIEEPNVRVGKFEYLPNGYSTAPYEMAYRITRGMTSQEVAAIIGSPQERITSGLVVLRYAFADGAAAHVEYIPNNEGLYVVESVRVVFYAGQKYGPTPR